MTPARSTTQGPAAAAQGAAETLAAEYRRIRRTTESLVEGLSAEDAQVQSMPDASPAKWHLAHTTWFFETFVLARAEAGHRPFHPDFATLFNSYYDAVGPQFSRPQRGLLTRPSLTEVMDYRRHVDAAIERFLTGTAARGSPLASVLELGLHHEQQHQELIPTDLLHLLSLNPLRPAFRSPRKAPQRAAPPLRWVEHPEAVREIGHDGRGFAYDNEGPRHRVVVPSFEIASRAVTNGEVLRFVEDGGYERADLWLSEGMARVRAEGWRAPIYWIQDAEDRATWLQFTLGGLVPLDPAAPAAHLSYFEADAYARWAGARLPTEAEWEVAASSQPVEGNFLEDGWFRPVAPAEPDPGRLAQAYGDVWEWTSSSYAPYPGYRPPEGAIGEYNGKFMVNQYVLRGGSCATPRGHARPTYRNFFPAHARWQFSGLRLAR